MRSTQRGLSLIGMIIGLGLLGFVAVMAAKLLPSYVEYYNVKKIFAAMEQNGDLKGSVKDIRASFDRRAVIDDVKSITAQDLEIGKDGGETVVSAAWPVKVYMVGNLSACLDFSATTAK